VTKIEGSVVGDGSRYDTQRFNAAWPARLHSQNVVGQLGALMVDDGFSGFPAQYEGPNPRTVAPDAAAHAAQVFTDLLRQRGVTVVGAPRSGRAPQGASVATVATLRSAPLEEIVEEMLTDSDNDTAELLLKELGRKTSGQGTSRAGAAAALKILGDAGIDTGNMKVIDGSGLSTDDRVSCRLLMGLLTRPGTGASLIEHAAVAGKTGTLRDPFLGSPATGRVRAKTGTLNTVTALAGRAEPTQGGSLTFTFITNRPGGPNISDNQATAWRRGLAEILVAYPRGVDIRQLLPRTGTR
jgi:serine-type D-Ala-D-Ala carboxypeptidase/endopeptidase (penicillin-binding protein 4)